MNAIIKFKIMRCADGNSEYGDFIIRTTTVDGVSVADQPHMAKIAHSENVGGFYLCVINDKGWPKGLKLGPYGSKEEITSSITTTSDCSCRIYPDVPRN